jgi:hypothetical protein
MNKTFDNHSGKNSLFFCLTFLVHGKNTYQPMLYIFYTPPSFLLGGKTKQTPSSIFTSRHLYRRLLYVSYFDAY